MKFTFPGGSIEFYSIIFSTMDVYTVTITSPDLDEPYMFDKDFPAFTKITEELAEKIFNDELDELLVEPRPGVNLGKAWGDWANDQTQEF